MNNLVYFHLRHKKQPRISVLEQLAATQINSNNLIFLQQVAGGEQIPMKQEEIKVKGHSFECRIYAEDPDSDFMPGAGPLQHLATPPPTSDLRIETGVRQGEPLAVGFFLIL